MSKVNMFNNISVDGYCHRRQQRRWAAAHAGGDDPEFAQFTAGNAKGGGALVFGRVTYEMMASFWPTPQAKQMMPEVAERMNRHPNMCSPGPSRRAEWANTTVLHGDPATEIARLKEDDRDMTVLGSGSIVAQLAQGEAAGWLQLRGLPGCAGRGPHPVRRMTARPNLKLEQSRSFRNGKTFLSYSA